MNPALYDSFIAEYYRRVAVVSERLQDVAFYREARARVRRSRTGAGCGTGAS